jgi:hypothetical protein
MAEWGERDVPEILTSAQRNDAGLGRHQISLAGKSPFQLKIPIKKD